MGFGFREFTGLGFRDLEGLGLLGGFRGLGFWKNSEAQIDIATVQVGTVTCARIGNV